MYIIASVGLDFPLKHPKKKETDKIVVRLCKKDTFRLSFIILRNQRLKGISCVVWELWTRCS